MPQDKVLQNIDQFHSDWSKLDKLNKMIALRNERINILTQLRYLTASYRNKGGFTSAEKQSYDNVMDMIRYWESEKAEFDKDVAKELFENLIL